MSRQIEAPEIAKEHGMTRLVFEDDFESIDTIDVKGLGTKGFKWYTTRPFRAKPLTEEDFRVENSVLYLEEHDSLYNYGLSTINPRTRQGFSFNKGVLEFRMRIPHYDKAFMKYTEPDCGGPAIWSFPPDKIYDIAYEWVEMDWMEYWDYNYYTTTLHHIKRDNIHDNGHFCASNMPGHRGIPAFGDGEWHTMTFLWDTGIVDSWVDGVHAVQQIYENGRTEPPAKFRRGEPIPDPYTYMNEQYLALIVSGAKNNPLEIDWIRVWQK